MHGEKVSAQRSRDILPFLAAVFIDLFSFGLMYPVIVLFFRDYAAHHPLSPGHLDLLMSAAFASFPFGMFFGASLLGDLSDALGRKRTLLLCLSGLTFAYLLMILGIACGGLGLLLAGRVLSGLMAGSAPIAQAAMMDLSTAATRGRNMSHVVLVNCLALASAPALGGLLTNVSLSLPLLVTLLLCLGALALIARARWTDTAHRSFQWHWQRPLLNFAAAARHPQMRWLTVAYFLFQLGFATYYIYVIVLMGRVHHLSATALGLFSGTMGLGFVLGSAAGYRILARLLRGDRAVCALSLLTCGLAMMLSAFAGEALQWPLAFFAALTDTSAYVSILALISAAAGARNQGWGMGIAASASAIAFFLAGLAADLLSLLPLPTLLFLSGLALLLGAAALKRLPRSTTLPASAPPS